MAIGPILTIAMKFVRLRQRVKIKVPRISSESVEFHFMKLMKMNLITKKKKIRSSLLNLDA